MEVWCGGEWVVYLSSVKWVAGDPFETPSLWGGVVMVPCTLCIIVVCCCTLGFYGYWLWYVVCFVPYSFCFLVVSRTGEQ